MTIQEKYQMTFLGDLGSTQYYLVNITNKNISSFKEDFEKFFKCNCGWLNISKGKFVFSKIKTNLGIFSALCSPSVLSKILEFTPDSKRQNMKNIINQNL